MKSHDLGKRDVVAVTAAEARITGTRYCHGCHCYRPAEQVDGRQCVRCREKRAKRINEARIRAKGFRK